MAPKLEDFFTRVDKSVRFNAFRVIVVTRLQLFTLSVVRPRVVEKCLGEQRVARGAKSKTGGSTVEYIFWWSNTFWSNLWKKHSHEHIATKIGVKENKREGVPESNT
jgi:hypothetical protein